MFLKGQFESFNMAAPLVIPRAEWNQIIVMECHPIGTTFGELCNGSDRIQRGTSGITEWIPCLPTYSPKPEGEFVFSLGFAHCRSIGGINYVL